MKVLALNLLAEALSYHSSYHRERLECCLLALVQVLCFVNMSRSHEWLLRILTIQISMALIMAMLTIAILYLSLIFVSYSLSSSYPSPERFIWML